MKVEIAMVATKMMTNSWDLEEEMTTKMEKEIMKTRMIPFLLDLLEGDVT